MTTAPANLNQELLNLLTCPVCMERIFPPFEQCHRGHLLCTTCRSKCRICPICRGTISGVRNLPLEKLADQLVVPCAYHEHGCAETMKYTDIKKHEKTCLYSPFACFASKCGWEGGCSDFVTHLVDRHDVSIGEMDKNAFTWHITNPYGLEKGVIEWKSILEHQKNGHFLLMGRYFEERFSFALFYFGAVLAADYEMSISHKGRKLLWSAPVKSVKKLEKTFDKDDCLQIPRNKALFMSDRDNTEDEDFLMTDLNLYISIELVNTMPNGGNREHLPSDR